MATIHQRYEFLRWKIQEQFRDRSDSFRLGDLVVPIVESKMHFPPREQFYKYHYNTSWSDSDNIDWKKRMSAYCKILRNPRNKAGTNHTKHLGYSLSVKLVEHELLDFAMAIDIEIEGQLKGKT